MNSRGETSSKILDARQDDALQKIQVNKKGNVRKERNFK
jgi:hypothetical protein